MPIKLTLEAAGVKFSAGALEGETSTAISLDLPVSLSQRDLETIARDCELYLDVVRSKPDDIQAILSSAAAGDLQTARSIAERCGFTEAAFQKKGGGLWLAIAIGAAILLYSPHAH